LRRAWEQSQSHFYYRQILSTSNIDIEYTGRSSLSFATGSILLHQFWSTIEEMQSFAAASYGSLVTYSPEVTGDIIEQTITARNLQITEAISGELHTIANGERALGK
jgi:hypothetical protein